MKRIAVVVPAGGAGRRMGGIAKPLIDIDGVSVLQRAITPFLERADVKYVVIALPTEQLGTAPAWLGEDPRVQVVGGGTERSDSVRLALAAVPDDIDIVLVHDAVRPFVDPALIERCVNTVHDDVSVVPVVPVTDTIKEVDEHGRVISTPDRSRLRAAQTPQAFPAHVLREAHARAASGGVASTDDASLVARFGGTVVTVEGDQRNMKITTKADLAVAKALLAVQP